MSRKLLYHRGSMDDGIGTYVTDYVQFGVCTILAAALLVIICKKKMQFKQLKSASTYNMIALQTSLGCWALFGGLVHQFLQEVEPYTRWQDAYAWVIVWRVGTCFAAVVCFSFLYIIFSVLTEEGLVKIGKWGRIVTLTLITLISTALCVYSLVLIHEDFIDDPWASFVWSTAVMACCILEVICVTIVAFRSCCMATTKHVLSGENNKSVSLPGGNAEVADASTNAPTIQSSTMSSIHKPGARYDLISLCIASWVFLIAGAFQYALTYAGCSQEDTSECPLPDSFNHNAIFHIVIILSAVVFFIAEYLSIERSEQLLKFTAVQSKSGNHNPAFTQM